jgi:hypothetical protein
MPANPREPEQQRELRHELEANPALVEAIIGRPDLFPPAPTEPDRVIRCSPANVDRGVASVLARAAVWREAWVVEINDLKD